MRGNIWSVMEQERGRGKHRLADAPAKQPGARWATGPDRARTIELMTLRAARLIAGGMRPPLAANRAIHEWGVRLPNSGSMAVMLDSVARKAAAIARESHHRPPRADSGIQNPAPPRARLPVPSCVLERRAMVNRVAHWGQSLS